MDVGSTTSISQLTVSVPVVNTVTTPVSISDTSVAAASANNAAATSTPVNTGDSVDSSSQGNSAIYTAVASVNASTIRGTNLNITA